MKKILLLLLLVPNLLQAQFTTASMQIDGLTCSMCQYGVERSVKKLTFIENVKVDLNTNTASITFKENTPVDIKSLIKSVFDAGFSVRNLTANYNFKTPVKDTNFIQSDNGVFFFLNPEKANLRGTVPLTFVEKKFTEPTPYKKYKKTIDEKLANVAIKDGYYFVLL